MVLRSCVVLFCLAGTITFAQPIDGAFMTNNKTDNQEGYFLSKTGEFAWFRKTNSKKEIGSGTYTLTRDSLQLNFKTTPRQFDIQAQTAVKTNTIKATLKVNAIRASAGKPFPQLRIVLVKSGISALTDRSGSALIEIETPRDTDEIYFEINGDRTSGLPIDLRNRDNFIAIVIDDITKYRENITVKLRINRSAKIMRLKNAAGEMLFKKTTRKKFMNSYQGV